MAKRRQRKCGRLSRSIGEKVTEAISDSLKANPPQSLAGIDVAVEICAVRSA